MKTGYKIIICCIATCIITAFVTSFITWKAADKKYQNALEVGEMLCKDNATPDANGCCPGESFVDMGAEGFNCCPDAGGDCFPPIGK